MKKVSIILTVLVLILVVGLVFAETVDGGRPLMSVRLKANQTISVYCQGDEIIVDPSSGQVDVTCRVWVNSTVP